MALLQLGPKCHMDIRPVVDPIVSSERWKALPVGQGLRGCPLPALGSACPRSLGSTERPEKDMGLQMRHDYLHRKSQSVYNSQITRSNK